MRTGPPFPNAPTASPVSDRGAAERWLGGLAAELEAEERKLEPAGFEEVARAAEHALGDDERALWEERVARDPGLARRAADLAAFRAEAYPERGRLLPFAGRPAGSPRAAASRPAAAWLGWAAAAAVLVGVLVFGPSGTRMAPEELQAGPAVMRPEEPVFTDGFEAGDPSSWTSVTTSG